MISSAELLLTLVAGLPAPTADTVPPLPVSRAVREALAQQLGADPEELVLEWGRLPAWAADTGAVTVRLGPVGKGGWLVATVRRGEAGPVAVRVRGGVVSRLPVASRPLGRGHIIADTDVTWDRAVAWGSANHSLQDELPIGWEVRRAVATGESLDQSMLQSPRVIAAGDKVAFVWQRGAVRLERVATAIASARLGESVRARAGDARLTGRATGPGEAILEGGSR